LKKVEFCFSTKQNKTKPMTSLAIPYIIVEIYTSTDKRVHIHHNYGVIEEEIRESYFVKKCAEFVQEKSSAKAGTQWPGEPCVMEWEISVSDIEAFWQKGHSWKSLSFVEGEWMPYVPSTLYLFRYLRELNLFVSSPSSGSLCSSISFSSVSSVVSDKDNGGWSTSDEVESVEDEETK